MHTRFSYISMDSFTTGSSATSSHKRWLPLLLAFLVGGALGYGVFACFAPNAEEIAERVRLDIEAKNEVAEHRINGTVESIDGNSFTVAMPLDNGQTKNYAVAFKDETVFTDLSNGDSRDRLAVGAKVVVTAEAIVGDGSLPLTAVKILILD